MAILGDEIWVEFGSLRTNLHESKIDESDLAALVNGITRDGTLRLDQRYIQAFVQSGADRSPQGSGYGKYEDCEQYVAAIANKLYLYDLTATLAETAVLGAGAIASGDWVFEQFESYIYMGNETAGLARKKICDGNDGTGDWTLIQKPSKPAAAPTYALATSFLNGDFTGGTYADSGSGVAGSIIGSTLSITTTAAGNYWVEVTLDTSPDLRIDAEYRDMFHFRWTKSNSQIGDPTVSIFEGSSEYDCIPWGTVADFKYFRMQNIARSNRNQITKIRFYFSAPSGTNTITVVAPSFGRVWMSLPRSFVPANYPELPAFDHLKFAYTHYNHTTGFESEPSDLADIFPAEQYQFGQWVTLTLTGTNESGVSHQRVYRVVGDPGNETYYRLGEVANPGVGTVTYTDKLALDEVELLDTYNPGTLAAAGITAIATWQNRLVLGVGNLVEISRSDDELSFVGLDGGVDEFDPGMALTFYCDDKRAEKVYGLASGDALTVVTDRSVRALFGTVPQNWRYVKLNSSEGAVGKRAWCAYRDGAVILTPSGRLLYVALGLEQPVDIGAKVRERIGNAGIKALATSDAVVAVRPDGQIEVRNSTGAYYIFDLDASVRYGVHTHPTHSALFVSGHPIRWIGTNGKLYEGGDDDFVTDGGTTGTDGVEVEGYVDTREWSLPRMYVDNVYWGDAEDHYSDDSRTHLNPRFLLRTTSREKEYHKARGKMTTGCSTKDSGTNVSARIYFDRFTPIPEFRIRFSPLSRADQK